MPLYLVLETGTNKRFRQSLNEDDVLPINTNGSEYLHVLQSRDTEPDEAVEPYDVVARDFVLLPPPPPFTRSIISVREFRNRLGQAVRLQILALRRSTDPNLATVRDQLEDMKETLDSVNEVDLENLDTKAGVQGLANLGQMGLLTFSAADALRVLAHSTVSQE